MVPPTQDVLAQNFQEANSRLRFCLESLVFDQAGPGVPTSQQMAALLSELLRAGEWLRSGLPEEKKPGLETELAEYRRNVERLRGLLPSIHRQLLQERVRLEAERARVDSAAAWVHGTRQTL